MALDDNYIENPIDGRPLSKPPTTIIGIILTLIAVFSFSYWLSNEKDLKRNGIMSTAKIIKWSIDSKSGKWLDYEFTANNKKYFGSNKYFEINEDEAENLVNKKIPVIFLSNNPDKNNLLIRAEDFNKYGVIQPDSLKKYDTLFAN